jgi:hypothetical protein
LLQALSKRQQANVTRDWDAVVSLEMMADEFKAGHLAVLGEDAKSRLKNHTGFVQYIATQPDLMVILFSADVINVLATTMAMGLCTTWYVDATGNLVSLLSCTPSSMLSVLTLVLAGITGHCS